MDHASDFIINTVIGHPVTCIYEHDMPSLHSIAYTLTNLRRSRLAPVV